jgi:hypothetical protein
MVAFGEYVCDVGEVLVFVVVVFGFGFFAVVKSVFDVFFDVAV